MHATLKIAAVILCVLAVRPAAAASGFTAFAEDEDVCRRAGTAAIHGAVGPAAAYRYDATYQRCMAVHVRERQMGAYERAEPPVGSNGVGFPDAYYSIPYATPGYGYDGFSP